MPLTTSLYREDEVVAALKWSLCRGQTLEAMFWAQECSDSNMLHEALQAALWVWMFGCGPSTLGWLTRFRNCVGKCNGLPDSELMGLIASLSCHMARRPNSSALVLLGLGLCDYSMGGPPDYPIPMRLPADLAIFDSDPIHASVARAIFQGKAALAWFLLRPLWDKNGWFILEHFKAHTDSIHLLDSAIGWMGKLWKPEYTWPLRAVAVAALSSPTMPTPEEDPHPDYMKQWKEWRHLPMRKHRPFQIPVGCLYWFTARGQMRVSESTEDELLTGLENAMIDSKVWSVTLHELHYSDESREGFYATYFHNDIPDEWSAEDRAKSHGRGVIPVGDAIDYTIINNCCFDRWFQRIPNCIWQGTERALTEFKRRWSRMMPQSLESGIHEAYSEKNWEFSLLWICPPTRREFQLISNTNAVLVSGL